MEKPNLRRLNEREGEKQYCVEVSKYVHSFAKFRR
jgi:hypothetical protein